MEYLFAIMDLIHCDIFHLSQIVVTLHKCGNKANKYVCFENDMKFLFLSKFDK